MEPETERTEHLDDLSDLSRSLPPTHRADADERLGGQVDASARVVIDTAKESPIRHPWTTGMIGKSGASCRSWTTFSTVRRWCSLTDNPVFATMAGSHIQSCGAAQARRPMHSR